MKTGNLSKKELSKRRLKVRVELDDWRTRLAGATAGLKLGCHTSENVEFIKDEIKKLNEQMCDLNLPVAKQLRWVGRGFTK